MTLPKNQRKADSTRRCLTTKWWTRSAASHLIETWTNARWTKSWTPAKTTREERSRLRRLKPEKNNKSLEKRPYPILSGFILSRTRWSRIIPKEWKLLAASSESMQRVTTVVSGRSVKCNEIFAVWFFAVVDLFSRPCGCFTFPISGNTMLRYEQQTLTTMFCTLKSDFLDVKSFEF